jgi:hypothetical protein
MQDVHSILPAKLRVSIDYGTKTLGVAFLIVKPGQDFTAHDVHNVFFGQEYWTPQQVAWDDNGKFYWGYDVDDALKTKEIRPSQIIELWKLLLYKHAINTDIVNRIQKQLGKRTLDGLLTTHFREIMTAVREHVIRHPITRAEYLEEVSVSCTVLHHAETIDLPAGTYQDAIGALPKHPADVEASSK